MRLLSLDVHIGSKFYHDKVVFRGNSREIIKILADKNKLYVMSKAGGTYRFQCFDLVKQSLKVTGTIDNVEKEYPMFVEDFQKAFNVSGNILLVD